MACLLGFKTMNMVKAVNIKATHEMLHNVLELFIIYMTEQPKVLWEPIKLRLVLTIFKTTVYILNIYN